MVPVVPITVLSLRGNKRKGVESESLTFKPAIPTPT